jgi:hypothetical protein
MKPRREIPKTSKMPGLLQLGGRTYKATVMRIDGRYDDGRIKTLTVVHDDQTVSLEDKDKREFTIVYVNEIMLRRGN